MSRSPRSRGKGNRRWSGRPGGAGKKKPPGPWEHRCQHLVADPAELAAPLAQLCYGGPWREKLPHRAYVFDQEMARLGIKYHAVVGARFRRRVLLVTIPESEAARVAECIARLERR